MSRFTRTKKGLIAIAAALLLAFFCEIPLSNAGYVLYHRRGDVPAPLTECAATATALPTGKGYLVFDECRRLDFTVNAPVHTLRFFVSSPFETAAALYPVTVSISYPGDEARFFTAVNAELAIGEEPAEFTVNIPAAFDHTAASVRIEATGDAMLLFGDFTLNPAYRFSFNALRFCIAAAVLAALFLSLALGLFHVPFDIKKRSHRLFAFGVTVFCAGCALFVTVCLCGSKAEAIPYPLEKGVESYNPYVQQFDAFMKGQAALDYEPDEALLALENPYIKENRAGIHYLWDRALYQGKYYSYFGIGPLLTVYAPFYAVTHALPSDAIVTGFFAVMTALFWSMAVFAWAAAFKKRVSLPLIGFGTVAGLFATGLFLLQRGRQPFYFIAVLSAAAFTCAFAFWAVPAFACKRPRYRRILFAAAGISFGLGFLCRVNAMIPPACIIAAVLLVYVGSSVRQGIRFFRLLPDLCCLALPVVLAAGTAFAFNYVRFGSPWEFGAAYQLTVSDISQNKIYFGGIAGTLFHYFFQACRVEKVFPYLRLSTVRMADYRRAYTYIDGNYGLFNTPLFLILPLFGTAFIRRKSTYEVSAITAGACSLFITAFLDFCLGGVIFRYLADISFTGAFLCLAVLFHLLQVPRAPGRTLKKFWYCGQGAGMLLLAATVVFGGAIALSFSANLLSVSPVWYTRIAAIFTVT